MSTKQELDDDEQSSTCIVHTSHRLPLLPVYKMEVNWKKNNILPFKHIMLRQMNLVRKTVIAGGGGGGLVVVESGRDVWPSILVFFSAFNAFRRRRHTPTHKHTQESFQLAPTREVTAIYCCTQKKTNCLACEHRGLCVCVCVSLPVHWRVQTSFNQVEGVDWRPSQLMAENDFHKSTVHSCFFHLLANRWMETGRHVRQERQKRFISPPLLQPDVRKVDSCEWRTLVFSLQWECIMGTCVLVSALY